MKTRSSIGSVPAPFILSLLVAVASGCGGGKERALQAENEALRAELAALQSKVADAEAARAAEMKQTASDAQGVARLRGEITQLQSAARDAEKLRSENQQLKSENQKLRGSTAAPPPAAAPPQPQANSFPRESWTFAGYQSPEAALVSAIWSMQQGNPKQYFDSLTPEEQLRMTKVWENKSQAEIAAKHQTDTAPISGMRVTETQPVSAEETVMKVFIEGVNREERVSMKRVGNEWKFNGFIREAQP
jgi:regulator of replication initiation timing